MPSSLPAELKSHVALFALQDEEIADTFTEHLQRLKRKMDNEDPAPIVSQILRLLSFSDPANITNSLTRHNEFEIQRRSIDDHLGIDEFYNTKAYTDRWIRRLDDNSGTVASEVVSKIKRLQIIAGSKQTRSISSTIIKDAISLHTLSFHYAKDLHHKSDFVCAFPSLPALSELHLHLRVTYKAISCLLPRLANSCPLLTTLICDIILVSPTHQVDNPIHFEDTMVFGRLKNLILFNNEGGRHLYYVSGLQACHLPNVDMLALRSSYNFEPVIVLANRLNNIKHLFIHDPDTIEYDMNTVTLEATNLNTLVLPYGSLPHVTDEIHKLALRYLGLSESGADWQSLYDAMTCVSRMEQAPAILQFLNVGKDLDPNFEICANLKTTYHIEWMEALNYNRWIRNSQLRNFMFLDALGTPFELVGEKDEDTDEDDFLTLCNSDDFYFFANEPSLNVEHE